MELEKIYNKIEQIQGDLKVRGWYNQDEELYTASSEILKIILSIKAQKKPRTFRAYTDIMDDD